MFWPFQLLLSETNIFCSSDTFFHNLSPPTILHAFPYANELEMEPTTHAKTWPYYYNLSNILDKQNKCKESNTVAVSHKLLFHIGREIPFPQI